MARARAATSTKKATAKKRASATKKASAKKKASAEKKAPTRPRAPKSVNTCHRAFPIDDGRLAVLYVVTDDESFASTLVVVHPARGEGRELLSEDMLLTDFAPIDRDGYVIVEGTGRVFEILAGKRAGYERANLECLLSGVRLSSDGDLWVHGGGRAFRRPRGKKTFDELPSTRRDIHAIRGDAKSGVYACGARGLFARLERGAWRELDLGTKVDLYGLLVRADGSVVVVGGGGFAGVWSKGKLARLRAPKVDLYDVAEYDRQLWIGAGPEGLGRVEKGALRIVKDNIAAYALEASPRYLAVAGDNEAVLYDGEQYACLEFDDELVGG